MSDPNIARTFLIGEVDSLKPFAFVAVIPSGNPLHAIEVARSEEGALEVKVPGRPPMLPELEGKERAALRERGFASEDPADRTKSWVCAAGDSEQAVTLLQAVLVEVFGEKPDATLDVAHGNREVEHEARRKLAIARSRIEGVVSEVLGHPAEQDSDKDYVLPIDDVHVTVAPRASPDGQVLIRIFSITNVAVNVSAELGLFLARLNFGLMFGRFALDTENRSIWFDETLLSEDFREEDLKFAIRVVATTADAWDDRLKAMFGGATHQEVLAGNTKESPPPTKPGGDIGQYL